MIFSLVNKSISVQTQNKLGFIAKFGCLEEEIGNDSKIIVE